MSSTRAATLPLQPLLLKLRDGLWRLLWGGPLRERLLLELLRRHYEALLARQFGGARNPPHYFDHRIGSFAFTIGKGTPFAYYRGYFASELVKPGDRLLDIGCGDGFFDRRFFSPKCSLVDAVDIEQSAIEHASRHNSAPNVHYTICDAVGDEFPGDSYDVVVWDGGIGHFAAETTAHVLRKIKAVLADEGVFVGSESLGHEGPDHLQFFSSLDQLCELLRGHFPHVEVRRIEYAIPGMIREEAFWRCAINPVRLSEVAWRSCATGRT